jgi:predicted nucleic acid-binding protein
MTLARRSASLSNSGNIFKHAVALPVPKSVSGRTRQSNCFGHLRQARATALIAHHSRAGSGVISTQVLHEFVNVAVRKLALPLDTVRQRVRLCARFETVGCSAAAALEALDLHALHQLSFRDALILQAARQGGCVQVPSEYLQAGAGIAGVRIVNPFAQTERALPY